MNFLKKLKFETRRSDPYILASGAEKQPNIDDEQMTLMRELGGRGRLLPC